MATPGNLRAGERRTATVLFADMKDFTSLSERMDPEDVEGLMSQVFGTFESIIHRYGGTVEKYIGDALVAVFGVPTLHEDDPARAINAALDFLTELSRLSTQRVNRDAFAFRIGINTGLVTTGRRGEHNVVTGHAMAVASRLQTSASANSILVSASTHDRCESDFVFSEPTLVQTRGKDGPLTAYEVRGVNSRPDTDDAVFIGRKSELDRMFRSFLRHDPTQTAGFVICGDAGMGKTRLANELIRKLRKLPDFGNGVLHARARRYGTRPFAVVIDLLTNYFEIGSDVTVDRVANRVEHELGVERRTALSFASLVAGEAAEQDNQAFVVLYLVLKSIVKTREHAAYSTVLCVDDLHYIDKWSRDFFQFYLRNADARPFFVLLNRDTDQSLRDVFGELEVIQLRPLDREETLQLVHAIASDDLDMEMVRSIGNNARGNPLFVREYVRYARDNRDSQTLPSSIQNIFLTSIETYDPALRDLLKKLSVFAHSFTVANAEDLHRATSGDPRMVRPAIDTFAHDGVLTQDGEQFMFRYDLFKTALYSSLLNYNKKILHRVVADLMDQETNPRLLHHLLHAEEYDRAADAMERAENCTSDMEYLRYIDPLLERIAETSLDRSMRLMFLKSAILFNNGITEEADTLLKRMIETAVSARSPMYAGSAYHLLTGYNMKAYSFEKAQFCGTKAIANYSRAKRGTQSIQNVYEIMATSELLRNNRDEHARIVERIRELERHGKEMFSSARLSGMLVEHSLMRGEYRAGLDVLRQALGEAHEGTETWHGLHLLLSLGHFLVCDWPALARTDQVVLEGPTRHLSTISQVHARLAVAHHSLGDSREADRRLQQAEFNASQIRNDFDRIDAYRTLAVCYLMRDDLQKAREFAEQGLTMGLRHTATYPVFTLLMVLVSVATAVGDTEAAGFYLEEAGLLVDSGVLLNSRDRMLYHYFRAGSAVIDEHRAVHRERAAAALRREIDAIGEPGLIENLFATRGLRQIHQELLPSAEPVGNAQS